MPHNYTVEHGQRYGQKASQQMASVNDANFDFFRVFRLRKLKRNLFFSLVVVSFVVFPSFNPAYGTRKTYSAQLKKISAPILCKIWCIIIQLNCIYYI